MGTSTFSLLHGFKGSNFIDLSPYPTKSLKTLEFEREALDTILPKEFVIPHYSSVDLA
jgi:hypothetical protein